tara:strand:- start:309 stop:647 length:339 start_codon:yes stop_codon:yes gene_type:complete
MGNTIMNMLGLGGLSGKEYLMAQTPRNTLLDSMSPEVAGMFQQQYGINPMVDPTASAASAATGPVNPMLALSALQGLLAPQQPQMMPMIQQQATPGLNLQMPSMNRFYGGLL